MGLFDHLTVNSFTTHLELAMTRSDNPTLAWHHVASALTAMRKIQSKQIETMVPYQGWKYAIHLSTQLGMLAAALHAKDALQDIDWITNQATRWRDEAFVRESKE